MNSFVYDSAVLIAADRNNRVTWIDHEKRFRKYAQILVPAPVLAQVSRSSEQVSLRRFVSTCVVVPFTQDDAYLAGKLLAKTRTSDVVDAAVVAVAIAHEATIVTGDSIDISRLVAASGANLYVRPL